MAKTGLASSLQISVLPAFEDNYLWLIHSPIAPEQVLAVDPGDADVIQHALDRNQLSLHGLLITHHHADHTGGITRLAERHQIPVFGPTTEAIAGLTHRVSQGQRVQFDEIGLDFEVLDTPGHTAGHIVYTGHGSLFCGDTLFSAGCGRLLGGSAGQMTASLQKLAGLPESTAVYCAHEYTVSNLQFAAAVEPDNLWVKAHQAECAALRAAGKATLPTSIGLELRINPFLRLTAETVRNAAERHAGRKLNSEAETFAVLRDWKNHFRG